MKERNQLVFFKKLPSSEETKPNAVYKRSMGVIPVQGVVCEIEWHGQLWMVKETEVLTAAEALSTMAKQYQEQIEKAHKGANSNSFKDVAKAFGKSMSTLRKRMKFVRQYLPKDGSEQIPMKTTLTA